MKNLIGKKILSYTIDEGGSKLTIITDKGKMVYKAYGDCCSESWFSCINGDIFNTVINVEEKPEPKEKDEYSRQDVDSFYSYTLTMKPEYGSNYFVDIEFRNSSNGYYGGSCDLIIDETK